VNRISVLVVQLNTELIEIVEPLEMTKVTMQEIQNIFNVIADEEWIAACFQDPLIGKAICILAEFLENY